MKLQDSIESIRGVGAKKSLLFKNMKIETAEDLLRLPPRKYEDRREVVSIMEAPFDRDVLVQGRVISKGIKGNPYSKRAPFRVTVQDNSANLEVLFFNAKYIAKLFETGKTYTLYGRITLNNGKRQMAHPEFHRAGSAEDVRGIFPVYTLPAGLTQGFIRKLMKDVLPLADEMQEWLPEATVKKYRLCSPSYAAEKIHFPTEERQIREARYRMVFEELLTLQTGLLLVKQGRSTESSIAVSRDVSVAEFLRRLPFELTDGQKKVWREIERDLQSEKSMNRLVQGDVGSGKTAVAELAMFKTVKSGFQTAMMAPTELLAKQHFASLSRDFAPLGLKVDLLCSSMKQKEKHEVLARLSAGETDVLVGTHAIIQPDVKFKALGLVITDEQHRFGVNQRVLLAGKGENPNVLVMTATPIPRTMAVIIYGDMDISVIDTMPQGRRPIRTFLRTEEARGKIYDFAAAQIKEGRQCYVVAPLIEESEAVDCRSAEELYEELAEKYPALRIGLVHGAMKQEEKDRAMEKFAAGETDILVSTVVIEVGIDVSNATVMIIENCERFGLSQLHQLRGRVGRGEHQSYCILVSGSDGKTAAQRNEIMCKSEDGFVIAEEDMRLRGPGEIFGTRQHGLPEISVTELIKHADVLEDVRQAAAEILQADPELSAKESLALKERIRRMFGENVQLNL